MDTARRSAGAATGVRRRVSAAAWLLAGALGALAALAPAATTGAQRPAPALAYSSYLGGNSDEEGKGVARDAAGNLYVVGSTYSTDFGGSPGAIAGSDDLFVAKFDPTGRRLIYRTLIGGRSGDTAIGIAVNAAGEAAVTAYTSSIDFPLLSPLLDEKPDSGGALVKLDASGALAFSTYVDVRFGEPRQNVAFDRDGNIVFTGTYWAGGLDGRENAAIFIISGDGSQVVQAGSFGGDWVEEGEALAIGADGKIYIAGTTEFRDGGFPLSPGAFQQTCGAQSYGAGDTFCDPDAFVAVLNPEGTEVLYATYLGGKGGEEVAAVGVDGAGNVYVSGQTGAQNFPTLNAFQGEWLGADNFANGFITSFTPDLSAQRYSTYLSSEDTYGSEYIYGMAVAGDGSVAVTGLTGGQYFPVKGAVQAELDGTICLGSNERYCYDAFVAAFDPAGALTFSTYLGGNDDDQGRAITGDGAGGFWVTGKTEASDFLTTADAAQPRSMMQSDAFLTHLGAAPGGGDGGGGPVDRPYKVYTPMIVR